MTVSTYRLLVVPSADGYFSITLYRDTWRGREKQGRLELQVHRCEADQMPVIMDRAARLVLEQSAALLD
jgi:hypothetical protein